jgi:hypothetical protein
MNRIRLEEETRFLERVARYRQEYRSSRTLAVNDERERRHANGEVYFAGTWVLRAEAGRIALALQRRELVSFFEIVLLLVVLLASALGMCWLFAFLFLP